MTPFLHESQRYEYDLKPADTVIDAGCFAGDFAAEIDRRYGCRIIALEPVPEFFANCVNRFEGKPNIKIINSALFNHNGPIRMGLSNNSSGIASSGEAWIAVAGITLGRLMQQQEIEHIALLKLNIETAEFPVLADIIRSDLMRKIERLQVQWHPIEKFAWEYLTLQEGILKTHNHVWGENPLLWESYEMKF